MLDLNYALTLIVILAIIAVARDRDRLARQAIDLLGSSMNGLSGLLKQALKQLDRLRRNS